MGIKSLLTTGEGIKLKSPILSPLAGENKSEGE
jgi:hypothetical protein